MQTLGSDLLQAGEVCGCFLVYLGVAAVYGIYTVRLMNTLTKNNTPFNSGARLLLVGVGFWLLSFIALTVPLVLPFVAGFLLPAVTAAEVIFSLGLGFVLLGILFVIFDLLTQFYRQLKGGNRR